MVKFPGARPAPEPKSTTYADAGVDIGAGRSAVDLFKEQVRSTFRSEVVGDLGGFGGAFAFDSARFKHPLLVTGTDGVGTKVMVAQAMGLHETIGIDLVAMSVNDIAAHGAEPLFFLDYIVIGKVIPKVVEEIVKGVAAGCRTAGCALLGGEVAEHPGHMLHDSYDLAGFCTGVVERDQLVTGEAIRAGDAIIGITSSGLHSNGYSLVRKVLLEDMQLALGDKPLELDCTLGEELLKPTLIYSPATTSLVQHRNVHGFAHITGGGMPENIARILPGGLAASIDPSTWEVPPIFNLIGSLGHVSLEEMFSTFNMGIGMVAVVPPDAANQALDTVRSRGFKAYEIGAITQKPKNAPEVKFT
ncbi:MAG: phosphoribosylformylglycinamidine cyclo-ligase [Actinomycetota bacterium]